jgi:drug/metabolite transporter (DMT)-like permease
MMYSQLVHESSDNTTSANSAPLASDDTRSPETLGSSTEHPIEVDITEVLPSVEPTLPFKYNPIHTSSGEGDDQGSDANIPSNHGEARDAADVTQEPKETPKKFSCFKIALAWACMLLAIMSGAAIGPAFKLMEANHVPPVLAASWRCQCMCFVLWPLVMIEARVQGTQGFNMKWLWSRETLPGLSYPIVGYATLAGVAWALDLLCWVTGLQYTTTVRASIFASLHPVILILYFGVWQRRILSVVEWAGTFVAFGGLTFAALDMKDNSSMHEFTTEALGDFLCILSAVGQAIVIVTRGLIAEKLPLMQYTAFTTLVVAFSSSLITLFLGTPFDFSEFGLFGWCTPFWIGKMFIFAFVVGVICVTGYNFAMRSISPLVFSSCLLVDPAITGLISWIIQIEGIPTLWTIMGGLVVTAGVGLIVIGEHRRERQSDRNEARIALTATARLPLRPNCDLESQSPIGALEMSHLPPD